MSKARACEKTTMSQASALVAFKRRLESDMKKFEEEKRKFGAWRQEEESRLREMDEKLSVSMRENGEKSNELDSRLIAIRDFIHEQRKFNERMTASVDKLKNASNTLRIQPYDQGALNLLSNTSKSVIALSQLSSMRMEMLEFNNAPDVFAAMASKRIGVWKEFEKVYKSINNGNDTVRDKFFMSGGSVAEYSTKRVLTIGIFIILENAWKYAPKDGQIRVNFKEDSNKIDVTVSNLGPKILPGEVVRLTESRYRGENARITPGVDGKGLGLNIAKDIFELCGVAFSIETLGNVEKQIGGVEYAQFVVHLCFPLK